MLGDGPTFLSNGFMVSFLIFVLISSRILRGAAACTQLKTTENKIRGKEQHWKIDFSAMANPFVNLTHSLLVEMQGIDQLMQVHRWSCLA